MARRGHSLVDTYKDEAPPSFQNNFTAGLKTEFTGLNFPPNAATETYDCIYTMLGDVVRRPGFDFEKNFELLKTTQTGAITSYHWKNAGGDGETQVYVLQIGAVLYFYKSSNATVIAPLSTTLLSSTVNLAAFAAPGSSIPASIVECQYADGNGYLFVYNSSLEPFYCSFVNDIITPTQIDVKIRDFVGVSEPGVAVNTRPSVLTDDHLYNLENQGWTRGALWTTTATAIDNKTSWDIANTPLSFTGNGHQGAYPVLGSHSWTVSPGIPIVVGTPVDIQYSTVTNVYDITQIQWSLRPVTGLAKGVVTAYDTGSGAITINITSVTPDLLGSSFEVSFASTPGGNLNGFVPNFQAPSYYNITASNTVDLIDTWFNQVGSYPSNADVWWLYKTVTSTATTSVSGSVTTTIQADTFDPGVTQTTVPVSTSPASKGHFIVNAFNQNQPGVSGIVSITPVTTGVRPRTGAWFQGRVWYAGCDAVQPPTGDQNFYTWTENIYFSQIATDITNFGQCYQSDDPTDENLFLLLPSDGGVITIQGCGSIFKLFPIQNGMLVFAANGVWFITGSTGIGFTANDYTITKISAVRSISSTSFVDVNGLPLFWNEEGIYAVEPAQQGLGLTVQPLTVGTIRSFYNQIPYEDKLIARGAYDPVNYVVQWLYNKGQSKAPKPVKATDFRAHIFDDSCYLETTTNLGTLWTESHTPTDTLGDAWEDLEMATIDGDQSTMVAFNARYLGNQYNGRLAISHNSGAIGSWTYLNPSNVGADGTSGHSQVFFSGAISKNGQTILALPSGSSGAASSDPSLTYPRISRDQGVTWSDITALGSGRNWIRACFGANAQVMYMVSVPNPDPDFNAIISKSIDGGVTWVDLVGPPYLPSTFAGEQHNRLRCSADGSVVLFVDAGNACVFVSRDGGNSWSIVTSENGNPPDFIPIYNLPVQIQQADAADCGVSSDGNTLIFTFAVFKPTTFITGYPYSSVVFISNDKGITWTQVVPPGVLDDGGHLTATACNVSEDGQAFIVAYENFFSGDLLDYRSDISIDQGITWTDSVVTPSLIHGDGYNAAYILPITTAIPAIEPLLVGVSEDGLGQDIITSPDAINWTLQNDPAGATDIGVSFPDVVYSPELDLFVAISFTTTGLQNVMTSKNGVNWTFQNTPVNLGGDGIVWSSDLGIFVIVGSDFDSVANQYGFVYTSPDGINWTQQTCPKGRWQNVCWGADRGLFVAVNRTHNVSTSPDMFMTSSDGITWTAIAGVTSSAAGGGWVDVCFDNRVGKFIASGGAPGGGGTTGGIAVSSSDATAWTLATHPAYGSGDCICYSPDLQMLVTVATWDTRFPLYIGGMSSVDDGITWQTMTVPEGAWYEVIWCLDTKQFVAVGAPTNVSSNVVMTSPDGVAWTAHATPIGINNRFWNGLAYRPGQKAITPPVPPVIIPDSGYRNVLNLNIFTKAFYPWTISQGKIEGVESPFIYDIKYVQNPGGEGSPDGIFKYVSSVSDPLIASTRDFTFSECSDPTFVDWDYATETDGLNYDSYFITGYSLDGQGLRKFQPGYINVFSRNTLPNAYIIQGLWDYAISGASGKWTNRQVAHNVSPLYGMVHKRHKIRGQGYSLQLKFSSFENLPFDIMGWSIWTTMNMGV